MRARIWLGVGGDDTRFGFVRDAWYKSIVSNALCKSKPLDWESLGMILKTTMKGCRVHSSQTVRFGLVQGPTTTDVSEPGNSRESDGVAPNAHSLPAAQKQRLSPNSERMKRPRPRRLRGLGLILSGKLRACKDVCCGRAGVQHTIKE
jgi:hypothetical protein